MDDFVELLLVNCLICCWVFEDWPGTWGALLAGIYL